MNVSKGMVDRLIDIRMVERVKLTEEITKINKRLGELRTESEGIEKEMRAKTGKDKEVAMWLGTNGHVVVARRGVDGVEIVPPETF